MTEHWIRQALDSPETLRRWLAGLGLSDPERGARDFRDLASQAQTNVVGVMTRLAKLLRETLPQCPDPNMALRNLERFVAATSEPDNTLNRLAESAQHLETVLQMFSTSQHLAETLIRDPGLLDWLHNGAIRRDRDLLVNELWSSIGALSNETEQRLAIRRFRHRETLRIGYDDIVRGLPLESITLDLSRLADSCVEVAARLARRHNEERYGIPTTSAGSPSQFVVLALGKLGGEELNYSSDIDLIFLYDEDGRTQGGRTISNAEFFARMGSEVVRLLADHTAMGMAYRVDMRLRPDGEQGALARSLDATLGYYVNRGRTWERQALIKCRPIAGDLALGETFLEAITPFVYRRYLGVAEIAEIKALKRRIEHRTVSAGNDQLEVKTGRGGIRDVEFVVQFLQLLHGGEHASVRSSNTLRALHRLEDVGCLTAEERGIMDETYRFLRRVEHRLQILFDRQTHQLPRDLAELRTLAIRMGYPPASPWEDFTGPAHRFQADYRAKTELNRRILNHLLHDAFRDDDGAVADPVVDLVLDPEPGADLIADILSRYHFRDVPAAYQNLQALAREDSLFLSQARCRHFLASIAPRLLQAVGRTPDPDLTLNNLEKVSASLGAKAMLWELFNLNPPSLRLYVEICANSQLLSEILITNPGMIDELIDSLVADRPQPAAAIKAELAELCRGAEDLSPILGSFRNTEWVRIGTRDILGREPIREVTRELADVAEAIVIQVARDQWHQRAERHGTPRRRSDSGRDRWAILGLGKFGGRELNYHSDLDLIFLHEEDGTTAGTHCPISNLQFVTEVAQRVLRILAGNGTGFPLYKVDTRLRPHGSSGPLVVTLASFREYFESAAQSWELLALTRCRVIFATGGFGQEVTEHVRAILAQPADSRRLAEEVLAMRRRLEASAGRLDLKRGVGGLADIEFLVQYLQRVHARHWPDILRPNIWDAFEALRRHDLISVEVRDDLQRSYDFIRTVESRIRLIQNRSGSQIPDDPDDRLRLARRLHPEAYPVDPERAVQALLDEASSYTTRIRAIFEQVVGTSQADVVSSSSTS
jgi:glutamate-ammonia-ligase adenylyltransferase